MDAFKQKLKEYITQQQQNGQPVESIRVTLVQHGWDTTMVDEAINELTPPPPTTSISLPEPVAGFGQPATARSDQVQPDSQQPAAQQPSPDSQQPQKSASGSEYSRPSQDAATDYRQLLGDSIPKASLKYKVFTAIADSVRAIKRNFKEFAAVALISIAIVLGISIAIDFLVTGTLLLKTLQSDLSRIFVFAITLGLILMGYIMTTMAMTLVQIVTTMAINEGADGRRTSVKAIISTGKQRIVKVIITNVLVGLIVLGPILLVSCIILVLAFSTRGSGGGGYIMGFLLLQLAATAWIIIALLRYLLAGQVAMLEPDKSAMQCLSRSKELLAGGGQWFIIKGTVLLILVVAIAAAIAGQELNQVVNSNNPFLVTFLIIVEVIANGVLVMLYRNRKLVKNGTDLQQTAT